MELSYCNTCEYRDTCELVDNINFCEDCKDYGKCCIDDVFCEAGHAIECNNGFEPKDDYCEDDEVDE